MSHLLNESNIEITKVTIPEDEDLDNVNEFLKTMGKRLKEVTNIDSQTIIRSLNQTGIIIKGTRNESYDISKHLGWKMVRKNPPKNNFLESDIKTKKMTSLKSKVTSKDETLKFF